MEKRIKVVGLGAIAAWVIILLAVFAYAKETSYAPVAITEDFDSVMMKMEAGKSKVMKMQMDLLRERYDLSDEPAEGAAA